MRRGHLTFFRGDADRNAIPHKEITPGVTLQTEEIESLTPFIGSQRPTEGGTCRIQTLSIAPDKPLGAERNSSQQGDEGKFPSEFSIPWQGLGGPAHAEDE